MGMSDYVFPQPEQGCAGNPIKGTQHGGISLRELFTAIIMQGMLSNSNLNPDVPAKVLAKNAVLYATAVLAELSRQSEDPE
jgi:hypothetical protein